MPVQLPRSVELFRCSAEQRNNMVESHAEKTRRKGTLMKSNYSLVRSALQKATSCTLSVVLACGLLPATSFANEAQEAAKSFQEAALAQENEDSPTSLDAQGELIDSTEYQLSNGEIVSADEAASKTVELENEAFAAAAADSTTNSDDDAALSAQELTTSTKSGTETDSGYCGTTDNGADGTNISYYYDGAGTLTLTGTGEPAFYSEYNQTFWFSSPVPGWYDYRTSITKVVIGEGITAISSALFAHTSITSVTLPSTIKNLDQIAFTGCSKLTSVKLNEGLESIGSEVFKNTAVTAIDIPSTVSSINAAFFRNIDVSNITISQENPYFAIENNVLYSLDSAKNKAKLVRASSSFTGTLKLPSTVIEIANNACESMTGITQVELPKGLTTIGEGAFNLSGLTSIVIPDSVTTIGGSAFASCSNMTFAHVGSGFKGSTAADKNSMFAGNRKLATVELSEGLEVIENYMFQNCTSLTSLTIPSTVTTIGKNAFYGCSKLSQVDIPSTVQSIGTYAFPANTTVTGAVKISDGSYLPNATAAVIEYDVQYCEEDARSMLSMINSFRTGSDAWYYNGNEEKVTASGLSELKYDKNLEEIAKARAAEIAIQFSHTRPDGGSWYTASSNGVTPNGENIAAGYSSAESVFVGWREDDEGYIGQGHRRNMLSSSFTAVGIAHVQFNGVNYWVQEFGRLSNTTSVSGNGSTYTAPYRVTLPYTSIKNFPTEFSFPNNLGLISKGQSATISPFYASGLRLSDTFSYGGFSACIYPILVSSNASQLSVSDNKVTALVNYPNAQVSAYVGGKEYTIEANQYGHCYEVGTSEFVPGKVKVTYLLDVPDGQVPSLSGSTLVKTSRGTYETLIDTASASALTDESFTLVAASSSDLIAQEMGDVTNNGLVNIVDAQVVYDMASKYYSYASFSLCDWLCADMNNDYVLDAADALTVQRAAVGHRIR